MLAWLYSRASKVYQWFGSSYNTWIGYLKNFFTWLKYYANKALTWAKDWALPKIISYWQDAKNRIREAKNAAIAWAGNKADEISVFLSSKIQTVRDLIKAKTGSLWSEISRIYQSIIKGDRETETGLTAWVKGFVNNLLHPFDWVLDFKELLEDLFTLLTAENKSRLLYLLETGFSFILDIVTAPLKIILGLLEPVFLEFISFVLGYALAGEKYELPSWPDWSYGYGGTKLKGFDPPPAAKRGLGRPLTVLYISGWRFKEGHRGLDLGLKNGDPVFAMHSGIVEYVNKTYTGYGFQVVLHGGPWWTRYAHLERLGVSKGDAISKGTVIGLGNSTGNSTGPHLHLEIKYNGKFCDPEKILF